MKRVPLGKWEGMAVFMGVFACIATLEPLTPAGVGGFLFSKGTRASLQAMHTTEQPCPGGDDVWRKGKTHPAGNGETRDFPISAIRNASIFHVIIRMKRSSTVCSATARCMTMQTVAEILSIWRTAAKTAPPARFLTGKRTMDR